MSFQGTGLPATDIAQNGYVDATFGMTTILSILFLMILTTKTSTATRTNIAVVMPLYKDLLVLMLARITTATMSVWLFETLMQDADVDADADGQTYVCLRYSRQTGCTLRKRLVREP